MLQKTYVQHMEQNTYIVTVLLQTVYIVKVLLLHQNFNSDNFHDFESFQISVFLKIIYKK
jgi:hypothetical protein